VAIVRRNVAEVIFVSRSILGHRWSTSAARGLNFLRVIYIGVDKLVNSEFKGAAHPHGCRLPGDTSRTAFGNDWPRARHRSHWRRPVSMEHVLGGLVALALFCYLVYALIWAERF
jgi:K+-transporting ATPase KdpF subunit